MKRLTLLLSLLLVAGLVCTGAQASTTHKLKAEVVSVDSQASTITVKAEDGKEMTAKVDAPAAKSLADLKAGDKVTLTCRDNDAGQHEAIVAIEKAAPKSGDANPPKS